MSASSTGKQYRIGRKLSTLQYVAVLVIVVISIVFYFIYDFLFSDAIPLLGGTTLALLFAVVDLLLIGLDCYLAKKVQAGIFYLVTLDHLEYSVFGRVTRYQWSQFTGARFGRVSPGVICPVTFAFQGREFQLNQYVERPWALVQDILDHITPYVQIEPDLREKVATIAGL